MKAQLIVAERSHIAPIAAHMRAADREEVWALAELTPHEALEASLWHSTMAWTALADGVPVAMFGVTPHDGGRAGMPWLLGTDALDEYPNTFGRLSRVGLNQMRELYPVLMNWSDARHAKAHAWLRWLGFTLGEPQIAGALGMPFVPFWMGQEGTA